jgi:hypothetical protein
MRGRADADDWRAGADHNDLVDPSSVSFADTFSRRGRRM